MAYFAASCDTPQRNKEFAESLGLDYPILSDPERRVARDYQLINENREFPQRWTYYIGKDAKILYIDKKVNTKSHGKDVVAQLKKLGVEKKKK